jgi:hypothetical protein
VSWARVVVALAAVVLLATAVFVVTQRHVTTPITREQALGRFRKTRIEPQPLTTLLVEGAPSPARAAPGNPRVGSTAHSPAPGSASASASSARSVAPTPPTAYTAPAEGVYAYRTTGGESISLGGASHTCSEPGRLLELAEARQVTFFGQTEREDLRCDPPALQHETTEPVGTATSAVCRSGDTTAHVEASFVGHDAVIVGASPVDAVRLGLHATITGRAHGTADEQMWVLPQTGLVLRLNRTTDADANGFFGADIHYHEEATFVLTSLTPSA